MDTKKIHFIAIGGNAMHNLAIALHKEGNVITGSDGDIFEPARSRLSKFGLLPKNPGWDAGRITRDLDEIILGMYAKADNPELVKAQELRIKIYSYPEYLYERTKNKTRVVIGGSHGKTTITAMVLHICAFHKIECDYLTGALLDGFEVMAKLSAGAKYAVFEGDEYLASALDRRPKFHLYKPNIALISGIVWDHINVFPTPEDYKKQFEIFADSIVNGGTLVYYKDDPEVSDVALKTKETIKKVAYRIHCHTIRNGITYLVHNGQETPLLIFGRHNLANIEGARNICNAMGISSSMFYQAITSFKGAAKRLEKLADNGKTRIFKDFAHAPDKLKASVNAVKEQYPHSKLAAFFELYTWSSFDKEFLKNYKDTLKDVDVQIIFCDPETAKKKGAIMPLSQEIKDAFNAPNALIFQNSTEVVNFLKNMDWNNTNLIMMSPGNYGGIDVEKLAAELAKK